MKILNPEEWSFKQPENNFLEIRKTDGSVYKSVECIPLFPLSQPDVYINLVGINKSGLEDIGMIENLSSFSTIQQALVKKNINFRYFIPEITDIQKITVKQGIYHWDVVTNKGKKRFLLNSLKDNISILTNGLISITDTDKCRYRISNHHLLPSKAQLELNKTLL
jgi:hypothetical protein